jgi:NADH dehydrogenase
VTGKARPADYARGNVEATEALVKAAERAGVGRFVFVSSIAVSFADRRHYPYSDSKAAAEAVVRSSSLQTTIVRPTMILGAGSPIQQALEKLARLPVAPMFGDGKTMVNPVEVDDVAALLAALVHDADAAGAVIEVGGPAAYPMTELFARLRGGGAPKFLHLPLKPLRELLAILEGPLLPLMPLTAGQLASFANDGVAEPSPLVDRLLPSRSESPAGPASAAAA